jgi:hypothetical protein
MPSAAMPNVSQRNYFFHFTRNAGFAIWVHPKQRGSPFISTNSMNGHVEAISQSPSPARQKRVDLSTRFFAFAIYFSFRELA